MEILTKTTYLKKSLQLYLRSSTFVKLKVNVPKDIQILAKTTYIQKEAENVRVNTSLDMGSSFCILLETHHHISIQLLSSVSPPVYFWRNRHQSVLKFKLSYGVI